MINIGESIRRLRKSRGYTQVEFAKLVGVTQATVTSWERNVNEPNFDMCSRIAGALGVPVSVVYPIGDADDATVRKISDSLHQNPKLGLLFDRVQLLKPSDLDTVLSVVNAIVKERDT